METEAVWPNFKKAPKGLSREAKEEWARLAPGLIAHGNLTSLDITAFKSYCHSYGKALRLGKEIREAEAQIHVLEQAQKIYTKQAAMLGREFGIPPGKTDEN